MSEVKDRLRRIPELDGIRGAAVAAVVIHHLSKLVGIGLNRSIYFILLDRVLDVGWLGVDIFFVLSGFLITGIILKERKEREFWSDFYLRRGFRILPVFIAVFVLTLLLVRLYLPEVPVTTAFVLPATFFMANWTILTGSEMPALGHLWSLAVEEQFYFLWPQAAKRLTPGTLFRLALGLAVCCEALRIALTLLHANAYVIYKITPTRIDGLAIGAALATGLMLPKVHQFLERWWKSIALVCAGLIPLVFLAREGNFFMFLPWSQVLAIPLVVILVAMSIYGAIASELPVGLAKFLRNPVMTWLGQRSYGLYLIHEPIHFAIFYSRTNGWMSRLPRGAAVNTGLILAGLTVSLILTEASWRLIESPAQGLRKRFAQKKRTSGELPDEEKLIIELAEESRTFSPPPAAMGDQ